MADEKVDIKLKVNVIDKELGSLIAKVKALEAAERRLASGRRAGQQGRSLTSYTKGWKKTFDFVDSAVKMTGKGLTKFLGLAIKGVVIEMALLSAALIGIHALFVAGRFLAKAYGGAMSLLAGGAAIAGAAIATVSAAIREQQAAIYAYRGKGAPQFGSAMNQTRMAMRNLQADTSLASLGIENLNKAYGVMSKTMNVNQINASGKAIKALMDFGSAGQDPAQAMEAVATVVAALSDQKKGVGEVLAAAQKLGPEMQKALKDAKVKTKDQFQELLFSGKLAELGGVAGQFDAVNNTLINVAKGFFNRLRTSFADFGDIFLEPLKVAFEDIFYVIKDGLAKMSVTIQSVLGVRGVTNGVVTMVTKVTDFMVRMMRDHLPGVVGMFKRIGDWWYRFKEGWDDFFDKLRPFQDGARSLYKALAPIWEAIKRGAQNLTLFNQLLQDNQGTTVETGQRIADLIDTISQLFFNLKKIFFEIAPFINDLLAGLNSILKLVSKLLTSGAGGGFAKALAPLLAFSIIGKKMGATGGMMQPMNFLQRRGAPMAITSPSVTVTSTGPISYGPGTAPAALSSGARGGGGIAPGALGPMPTGPTSTYVPGGPGGTYVRTTSGLLVPSTAATAAATAGGIPRFTIAPSPFGITGGATSSVVPGVAGPAAAPYLGRNDQYRGMFSHIRANAARLTGTMLPPAPGFGNKLAYNTVRGIRAGVGGFGGFMNFMNTGGWDPERGQYTDVRTNLAQINAETKQRMEERRSGFGRSMERLRGQRLRMRELRQNTTAGRAYSRFGQSAGGRMGTAMGLSLASQYAPEEMRGAMALGGMASMIDPRLGLAVAGVGGALTAKSAGAGALAGAAGGAQIGMMFGPTGAAVGAGIGLVVGGIMGAIREGKQKLENAKAMAQESLNKLYSGITESATTKLNERVRAYERGEIITGPGVFDRYAGQMAAGRRNQASRLLGAVQGSSGSLEAMLKAYQSGAIDITEDKFKELTGYTPSQLAQYLPNMTEAQKATRYDAIDTYLGGLGVSTTHGAGATVTSPKFSISPTSDYEMVNKGFDQIQTQHTSRMAELSKMTGKSSAEIEILAAQMGVNLTDPMLKFGDLVEQLGLKVRKTSQQLADSIADSMIAASGIFRTQREQQDAISALSQMSEGLAAKLDSGNLSEYEQDAAIKQYFEEYSAVALTAAGGDPMKALLATRLSFESGAAGGVYGAGQVFAGQYETMNPVYQQYMKSVMGGVGDLYAGQIQAELLAGGQTADFSALSRAIAGMTPQQMQKMMDMVAGGGITTKTIAMPGGFNKTQTAEEAFKSMGIDVKITKSQEESLNTIAEQTTLLTAAVKDMDETTKGLRDAVIAYNRAMGIETPTDGGDRSTPRGDTTSSRLAQTMSRHASFDSMVAGNRLVTSSYRNFNLGSMNSDHVTGRAYDLTGQNLGQYARLVHDNGGFAEFHGTMANRHLHVVPGIGDTAMPAMPMMTTNSGGGSGGVSNIYNIEINGTNQSPEQIANMVVAKIDQRERSYTERI